MLGQSRRYCSILPDVFYFPDRRDSNLALQPLFGVYQRSRMLVLSILIRCEAIVKFSVLFLIVKTTMIVDRNCAHTKMTSPLCVRVQTDDDLGGGRGGGLPCARLCSQIEREPRIRFTVSLCPLER